MGTDILSVIIRMKKINATSTHVQKKKMFVKENKTSQQTEIHDELFSIDFSHHVCICRCVLNVVQSKDNFDKSNPNQNISDGKYHRDYF